MGSLGGPGAFFENDAVAIVATARPLISHNPAQVIAASYERAGLECTTELGSGVAFLLYDKLRQCLVGASELTSRCPLGYWTDGSRLVIGSRVLPLVRAGLVPGRLDDAYLAAILVGGGVLGEGTTPFGGVRRLQAGEVLVSNPDRMTIRRVDRLIPRGGRERSPEAWYSLFWNTLGDSLRCCDLNGACVALSGGLDSSAVATAVAATHGPFEAFSLLATKYCDWDEAEPIATLERAMPMARFTRIDFSRDDGLPDLSGFDLQDDPP